MNQFWGKERERGGEGEIRLIRPFRKGERELAARFHIGAWLSLSLLSLSPPLPLSFCPLPPPPQFSLAILCVIRLPSSEWEERGRERGGGERVGARKEGL